MRTPVIISVALLIAGLGTGCKSTPKEKPRFSSTGPTFTGFEKTNSIAAELLTQGTNLFTIGPGDRLEIEVLGQPGTRALTPVGPDGKVYFHLLPGTDVWGLTLSEARDRLEKELGKYLNAPQLALTLRQVGSRQVWLLGRLNKPGIYPMPAPMSLVEAISLAGGTARSLSPSSSEDLADLRHSFVMRGGKILPVNFLGLLKEGDTSQNIILQPDDFVYIPSLLAQEVYVLGAVKMPRAIPYSENLNLISAITGSEGPIVYDYLSRNSTSFGIQDDAYLSHVAIVRGSLSEPEIAVVDVTAIMKGQSPNIRLEPGDIVYVPNSPYRVLKTYVNLIVNTFVGTVAANEGINAAGGIANVTVSVPVSR